MCRIETLHEDSAAYNRFINREMKDPANRIWAGDTYSEALAHEGGNGVLVVSYLAREGAALPSALE